MDLSRQTQKIAAAFSFAAFGFALSNLLAETTALNWLYTGLAAFVSVLIWQLEPRVSVSAISDVQGIGDQYSLLAGFSQADFDSLPLPVLMVDARALIVSANKSAAAQFGRFESGAPLLLRFRSPEMREAVQKATDQRGPAHFEMHERVPLERWMRVDICPVTDGLGAIVKTLILFRDISESRRLDRMRADFVSNASHELRTPLASMSGFIDTLRGPAKHDAPARERFLGIMQEQANRMSRLIDDLLSLSRLETRSLTDDAAVLDLVSATNQAIDSMQPVATESGVEIERRFASGVFMISGMRDEIIQVVENLVENACKYGKSGKKVVLEISRRKVDDANEIILSVRDFGPGIEAEHLPRLTERFYRASTDNASQQKGTGLGLAIVKHIVTRHRGRLSINSQPGRGSTFSISLPETVEHAE
jgi:two-component system, OmpR family, phosphate regulon sensor histidine kinase PhoR